MSRIIWLSVIVLTLTGCAASWEPVPLIAPAIESHPRVRVTRVDGSRVILRNPQLEQNLLVGDTIQELCGREFGCVDMEVEAELPLDEVASVLAPSSRGGAQAATVAGAVVLGLLGLLLYVLIACDGGDEPILSQNGCFNQ